MTEPVLEKVRQRIELEGLSLNEASSAIGIGASALEKHLAGEYVRSDSLAKYRLWLDGVPLSRLSPVKYDVEKSSEPHSKPVDVSSSVAASFRPDTQLNVVDLFCGCGGMSLGFERLNDKSVYRVAMALDIEAPMVKVFNDNHPSPSAELPIARQSDISDFMNEAEIQGFYLDHLARTTDDHLLKQELDSIPYGGISSLRATLHEIDSDFLEELYELRKSEEYISAIKKLGTATLGQTSIAGFHNTTKLPTSGLNYPRIGPLIWNSDGQISKSVKKLDKTFTGKSIRQYHLQMEQLWELEIAKLAGRAQGAGRGQLASAADRMNRFLDFTNLGVMDKVRSAWVSWRSKREALRSNYFTDRLVKASLQNIYDNGRQVTVLLGGPPCQGFSRIGRGKIRSLREQSVHAHEDADSVDSRNQLMHQYVLFVAALAPKVFIFENVRHFQAVVKSEGIEFDAADILAEAIQDVSSKGLGYAVSRKIVIASQHAVPQARERFVMAGLREDFNKALPLSDAAGWCISLPIRPAVPLQVALEGLPEPHYANKEYLARPVQKFETYQETPNNSPQASDVYRNWAFRGSLVDAHLARPPRKDDERFFALMGPGKRWMDYRCSDSTTLLRLNDTLNKISQALKLEPTLGGKLGINAAEISSLAEITDGSLSLRLLLESIEPQPGELQHHLLASTYLRKREGSHGDWLSRMDPALPSKTIVSHMAKDTYAFVHPYRPRTLSVREAARVQSFPDDYKFSSVGLVDGFKVVGNAVPPLLSLQFAEKVTHLLMISEGLVAPSL